jgi:hypothetical protein
MQLFYLNHHINFKAIDKLSAIWVKSFKKNTRSQLCLSNQDCLIPHEKLFLTCWFFEQMILFINMVIQLSRVRLFSSSASFRINEIKSALVFYGSVGKSILIQKIEIVLFRHINIEINLSFHFKIYFPSSLQFSKLYLSWIESRVFSSFEKITFN